MEVVSAAVVLSLATITCLGAAAYWHLQAQLSQTQKILLGFGSRDMSEVREIVNQLVFAIDHGNHNLQNGNQQLQASADQLGHAVKSMSEFSDVFSRVKYLEHQTLKDHHWAVASKEMLNGQAWTIFRCEHCEIPHVERRQRL